MAKRRGHGEGSVYRRKDGQWCATVELGRDPRGKRQRRIVYASTKKAVLDKLEQARAWHGLGLEPLDARTTTGQWLDTWLTEAADDLSPTSVRTYRTVVDAYLKPHVGAVRLARLSVANVETMQRVLLDRGLSPASVKQARTVLRTALSVAERRGHVPRNVAAIAKGPKRGSAPRGDDYLTAEQADAVMEAAEGDRLAALPVLLLTLGLRKGEALGLRWEDVTDLDNDEDAAVTVSASLSRVKGQGLVRGATKTVGSARTVPLVEPALSAIRAHRKAQAVERLAATYWRDDGIVFATESGTYLDPRNALRAWHEWTEAAGLGKRRMHASRHTAATMLLEAGVPLEVVSAALGHSSIQITADTYARVSSDAKRKALGTLRR